MMFSLSQPSSEMMMSRSDSYKMYNGCLTQTCSLHCEGALGVVRSIGSLLTVISSHSHFSRFCGLLQAALRDTVVLVRHFSREMGVVAID